MQSTSSSSSSSSMFISQPGLSQILTCKICSKFFKDPVLLPCGQTVCKEHVELKKCNNGSECLSYKCQVCPEEHRTLDKQGFAVNAGMNDILKLKGHSQRPNAVVELKLIEEFDALIADLRLVCKDPSKYITNQVITKSIYLTELIFFPPQKYF